ncbi:MAG: hypothetical protein H5T69_15400 [Chloroflexi bacterium]|nr:hypothetical protein [Chloroflexota bacterium]
MLIMRLLEAADLNAALREHQSKIDEVFLHVLSRYIETANEEGDEERASKLTQILNATIDMLEEKLPPQERLINRLLRAEYPEGTNAILEQHRGLLNRELLSLVDDYLKQLQGDQDKTLLEHLRNVRGQIEAKLTILRA